MMAGIKLTKAQQTLIDAMKAGHRLWVCRDGHYELDDWRLNIRVQKRTVQLLLKLGLIEWDGYENASQLSCGMRGLSPVKRKGN